MCGVLIIAPSSLYISNYSVKKILIGMGISLVSTFISVIIMGEKLHLYYLNAQNAKDSISKTSEASKFTPYVPPKSKNMHPATVNLPKVTEEHHNVVEPPKNLILENIKSDEAKPCQILNRNVYVKDKQLILENLEGTLRVNESDLSPTGSNGSSYIFIII